MKFLLFISYMFFASGAWAECSPMPSCDELNFKDTSCQGDFITCPFDKKKLKCLDCPACPACEKFDCSAYKLSACPDHGTCSACGNGLEVSYKLDKCEDGYALYGDGSLGVGTRCTLILKPGPEILEPEPEVTAKVDCCQPGYRFPYDCQEFGGTCSTVSTYNGKQCPATRCIYDDDCCARGYAYDCTAASSDYVGTDERGNSLLRPVCSDRAYDSRCVSCSLKLQRPATSVKP